jgi:hypothetical protein
MFLVEMEAVIGVHRGPMYYNARRIFLPWGVCVMSSSWLVVSCFFSRCFFSLVLLLHRALVMC